MKTSGISRTWKRNVNPPAGAARGTSPVSLAQRRRIRASLRTASGLLVCCGIIAGWMSVDWRLHAQQMGMGQKVGESAGAAAVAAQPPGAKSAPIQASGPTPAETKQPASPTPPPKPAQPAPPARKKQLPPPEEVAVRTKEPGGAMELKGTFYPGSDGKNSVPIILLHMWKGSRADFASLVPILHEAGHAVLVPDLRGHGQSRRRLVTSPRGPGDQTLDAEKLTPADFADMVQYDLEAWKRFLLERNDAEALNIEKLCVVGAEMGAAVALNWAALDWSWPQYPGMKQGQDVKALVLISPPWNFRGLDVQKSVHHPVIRGTLSVLLLAGMEDPRSAADARRIYGILEKHRPKLEDLPPGERTLFFGQLPTSLQGTRLLGVPGLNVESAIARFIEIRLVKQDYPWKKRLTKAN